MECMIAFWKALDVYFRLLKSQLLLFRGLGDLGLEVEAVHWESEYEQRIWGFSYEGFPKSNEVILFSRISRYVKVCSGILYGILDDDLMGFECVKVGCSKLGVKQGTLFLVPLFWPIPPSSNLILILKFL